jgi:hypothetical protein
MVPYSSEHEKIVLAQDLEQTIRIEWMNTIEALDEPVEQRKARAFLFEEMLTQRICIKFCFRLPRGSSLLEERGFRNI